MKIVKMSESIKDDAELKQLMDEKTKIDSYAKMIQDRIRKIIYKYDSAKMDYTKKA